MAKDAEEVTSSPDEEETDKPEEEAAEEVLEKADEDDKHEEEVSEPSSDDNDAAPVVESTVIKESVYETTEVKGGENTGKGSVAKPKRLASDLPYIVWGILTFGLLLTLIFYFSGSAVEIEDSEVCLDCSQGSAMGIFVRDDYVYLADNDAGLTIVDISDPDGPKRISQVNTAYARSQDVVVHGTHAYIADGIGISIIDIEDPYMPVLEGNYTTNGFVEDVALGPLDDETQYAYVADGYDGLKILDVTDPADIKLVGEYGSAFTGYVSSVEYDDSESVYIIEDGVGIRLVSVADPKNPTSIHTWSENNALEMATFGDYLCVAAGNGGLMTNGDITNWNNLYHIGSFSSLGFTSNVDIENGLAYVYSQGEGIQILDIGEAAPEVGNSYNLPFKKIAYYSDTQLVVRDMTVKGDYVYIASGQGGLTVVNTGLGQASLMHNILTGLSFVLTLLVAFGFNEWDRRTLSQKTQPLVNVLEQEISRTDNDLTTLGFESGLKEKYLIPAQKIAEFGDRASMREALVLVGQGSIKIRVISDAISAFKNTMESVQEARDSNIAVEESKIEEIKNLFNVFEYIQAEMKAHSLGVKIAGLHKSKERAENELSELKQTLSDADAYININKLEGLSTNDAETKLNAGYPNAALEEISKVRNGIKECFSSAQPRLTAVLPKTLEANVWVRIAIAVTNEGDAHAKNIQLSLDGIDTRDLMPIETLRSGDTVEVETALRTDGAGSIPVTLSLNGSDAYNNSPTSAEIKEWIDAGAGGPPSTPIETTLPPTKSSASLGPTATAEDWRPPEGLEGDLAVLGEYFSLRRRAYQAAPENEALLDELHNRREDFAISSYFEIPTVPSDILQEWALPPNLRGNIHLDTVRKDIIEQIVSAPSDENFVIIGEPGVGKTVLLFEVLDRLMAQSPVGIITTSALGNAHLTFGTRLFYDDVPENMDLVDSINSRQTKGLILSARELDWQALPEPFQGLFKRLTVPLFTKEDMVPLCHSMLGFSGLGYDKSAIKLLVNFAEGSPIYVWSLIRELMHSGIRTLSETYIREHATKGMANYVAMLLQRLLKDGKEFRPGGLHALTCMVFLAEYLDERRCHDLYFRTAAEVMAEHTEKEFDDSLHMVTFNHVMAYLSGEGAVVHFPHDTWVDVLGGAGSLNPFRAEIQTIHSAFEDTGIFREIMKETVVDTWSTLSSRYRRSPARNRDSFLALADTLLRNFTISDLKELDVDCDLMREVASSHSHLPLAAMLVSKLQTAQPTQVSNVINIQDSVINRSEIG